MSETDDRINEAVCELRAAGNAGLTVWGTWHTQTATAQAALGAAEAARETRDLLRAILAELQAQRPATAAVERDPAAVALGEGD